MVCVLCVCFGIRYIIVLLLCHSCVIMLLLCYYCVRNVRSLCYYYVIIVVLLLC